MPLSIAIHGPPQLSPDGATLDAGASITASVDATATSCQATPAAGISVTSGTANLMGAPVAAPTSGGFELDITAGMGNAMTVMTTVSCSDAFGQAGSAVFSAKP